MLHNSAVSFAICGGTLLVACEMAGCASHPATDPQVEEALRQAGDLELSARPPSQRFTAYVTGYSYWDNTPAGSATIASPVIHQSAGGLGTYADPITLAVGYSIIDGKVLLDVPAGTRFYLERLRKYAIVEDVCGNGPGPQDGPCHTGHAGAPWLDIYIGGESTGQSFADSCARRITAFQTVIMNPPSSLPVSAGEVATSAC